MMPADGAVQIDEEPKPWQRQPGEPPRAFAVASRYFRLGTSRSLDEVARRGSSGSKGAPEGHRKKADGRLKRWSVQFRWVERARAWDAHVEALRVAAVEVAEREDAERLAKTRHEQVHKDIKHGQKLQEVGLYLVSFPVVTEKLTDGGKVTVIEPANPRNHVAGANLLVQGSAMVREACDRGLELAKRSAESRPAAASANPADVLEEAGRGLDVWVEAKKAEILGIPSKAPNEPEGSKP